MSVRNGVVPPSAMRVLTAIAFLQEGRKLVGWRSISRTLGMASLNSITEQMRLLKDLGLIATEKDCSGRHSSYNSVRPTCRFIPADQL